MYVWIIEMLAALIEARGGFDRLNTVIKDFRARMKISFQNFLASAVSQSSLGGTTSSFDWEHTLGWGKDTTRWVPEDRWRQQQANNNSWTTLLPIGRKSYPYGWPHHYEQGLPYW